ncbi:MAG: ABC transporter permease [Chloroflexi bacterium]|nr:ABC transporter permease [Chloroflexota bacterium]
MGEFGRGIWEGLRLIFGGDAEVWRIVLLSLWVSGMALLFSMLSGIPLGAWIALSRFPGRRLLIAMVYTGMGLPPVVVGLFVYLMLSRSGPAGILGWLFTPWAMMLAQAIIAFPLVMGLTLSAVKGINPRLRPQLVSLGATPRQATLTLLKEARMGVIVAVIAGMGGIISEVGAVMMVGGNIEGHTRVMTTAIVLETRQGQYSHAIALSFILLSIAFVLNLALLRLQGRSLD